MRVALIAWLLAPAAADASVVRELTPSELIAGSDAVVEGVVTSVTSSWSADRTGLETRIVVAVERAQRGVVGAEVDIVHPGGEVDGDRHVIPGMPEFTPGEAVRVHLRARAGDDGYRVYGWSQGKWPGREVAGAMVYAPAPNPAASGGMLLYTHNGMVWPPSKIPVAYQIDIDGSEDLPLDDVKAAIFASFATWQDVPCSSLTYTYAGDTDLGVDVDGNNVILWIESGWIYGDEAAAATSLWIPIEEERTADVAFNGQRFTWAIEPEASISFTTLDVQAVLTHELGHFSGLSHTDRSVDTMYLSWRPWPGQRTLSEDDKLGVCALYPQTADECQTSAECAGTDTCESYQHGTLCTAVPDPIGASCNYERIECEDFCLFTNPDLSTGYCSRLCEQPGDCPTGFRCAEASAGSNSVMVCFTENAAPDAGPGDGACSVDGDCPSGQHCGDDGRCDYQCLIEIDCPSEHACDERGRCVAANSDTGGCGCQTPSTPGGPGELFVLAVAVLWLRYRRHGSRR